MSESKQVAVCILQYLKNELTNPSISDESKESLEGEFELPQLH